MDACLLQKAFLAGVKGLEIKKDWINELNVFPVPDGDTGTNMAMTIEATAKEVMAIENVTIESLAKAISSGSLRGARGNSGVILSQLFRGFTKEIKDYEELDVNILARAFARGTESAYKAVMKPKEGTILTVARAISEKAMELAETTDDILKFSNEVISHGEYILSKTPEMLPVLKEAGVVDSGGQGLMEFLKGALDGLLGKEIDYSLESLNVTSKNTAAMPKGESVADIKFGYCTEFIIQLKPEVNPNVENQLKTYLETLGDSLVVVADDEIVKVHVHTNDPGLAIQKALTYGELTQMKIDNMREEHRERLELQEIKKVNEKKDVGFIAVAAGSGLKDILLGIGIDHVIEGGQTMNPSTEDILTAIEYVNADTVYIFPNNKNIILAAEQTKKLVEDREIIVVPSTTVAQGITAMINYVPDQSSEDNLLVMQTEIKHVKTGQVTYAVRDTTIDGIEIHSGSIMGIGDNGILSSGETIRETTLDMLEKMMDEDSELLSIYYGEEVSEEEATNFYEVVQEKYPDCEIEFQYGGQPVYYYIISVE